MISADAVKVFFVIFSALLPIVNPLSGSLTFLAFTEQYSLESRRKLSCFGFDSLGPGCRPR